MHPSRRFIGVTVVAAGLALVGCESDDAVSPDPDGLEEPADDPEGGGQDGLDDAEEGTGEPAIEGDSEGRLDPDSQDDDQE